nr:FAR1 DNA binding domain-containing protein [Tanacetum cinerariifolium]GEW29661.1 FAR1 DNA binding domain-containing protein [Tanacetum cinerariifolium]
MGESSMYVDIQENHQIVLLPEHFQLQERLASDIHSTIEDCISLFRNDSDKLSEFLSTVKELKKKLEDKTQVPNVEPNKDDLYSELLDESSFKRRTCSACGGKGHNKATCKGCSACGKLGHHKGVCKASGNQDNVEGGEKNVVDDEDECDNDYEFDDEDEGDTTNLPMKMKLMKNMKATKNKHVFSNL